MKKSNWLKKNFSVIEVMLLLALTCSLIVSLSLLLKLKKQTLVLDATIQACGEDWLKNPITTELK